MKQKSRVLLIDDDESLCRVLERQLSDEGYQVTTALNGEKGLELFKAGEFDVVLTDMAMPGKSGIEVLRAIRTKNTRVLVIIITAFGTIDDAIKACRAGADDYITKPFSIDMLCLVIEKALRLRWLEVENVSLKAQLEKKYGPENLIGESQPMRELYRIIQKVAPTDTTVLIQGESGTGKELVARAIHALSPRSGHPFVPVDCAAIPDTLLESELFGHVKGAFTGAVRDRKGKFESAEKGTLFLDEIGDMKSELQAKLLRCVQERRIEKVGSDKSIPVDVRILVATNKDLAEEVKGGRFRQDLFYRLAVVTLDIPPLRERREDIPLLVSSFVERHGKGRKVSPDRETMRLLKGHDWPGNVRELENVIESALVLSDGDTLSVDDLPVGVKMPQGLSATEEEPRTLGEIEKRTIIQALEQARGNQSRAARELGISRHVLIYRMKKWGIVSPRQKDS